MRCALAFTAALLVGVSSVSAHGLLIPEDKKLPPLAMLNHHVSIEMVDQVAVTTVEQAFRNHTDRQLEATYVFPVPKGANVNKFTMWIDDKEVTGELLKAGEARQIYTDIVRRTKDPALLEYMDGNILRLRIFPVPPQADQRVKLSFTAVAPRDNNLVEYVYPLKSNNKAVTLLEDFSIKMTVKSSNPIQSIYSPTHAIDVARTGEKEARIDFKREEATLNQDFQLFYSVGDEDIGVTMLPHRPIPSEDGYFLLLISPQLESAKDKLVPRDVVMVLDTSGSMDGVKMSQARKALRHVLENLNPQDRFGVISFATTVRTYRDDLVEVSPEYITNAKKWVDDLRAGGGTAIQPALDRALRMRSDDKDRTFTLVFFTDGQPTLGEMKPENILKNVEKETGNETRIFTFGVGDDVNATLLDQLAEKSRAVSTYVRPAEDIAVKVSSMYNKISHPVMANVQLTSSENIDIHEVYPPQLPDLFHGSQLVVLGRYNGEGAAAVKLAGTIGTEERELAYDVNFTPSADEDREFVEHLWARRKVGYLLDQIRLNGEQKEVMDELMALAKRYGIATPYTSYLVVPDAPMATMTRGRAIAPGGDVGGRGTPGHGFGGGGFQGGGFGGIGPAVPMAPPGLLPARPDAATSAPEKVIDFARRNQARPGDGAKNRAQFEGEQLDKDEAALESLANDDKEGRDRYLRLKEAVTEAKQKAQTYDQARKYFEGNYRETQSGRLGVDLSVWSNNLRAQKKLEQTAISNVNGRNCMELGGVWIDEEFSADQKAVIVKAQSDAYFRILEKQPKMRDVFKLGNHLVWITPNNQALVIDANDGREQMTDKEIDELFVMAKK